MNRQILDSLIQDESIRSLLEKSADAYWLSEIYDYMHCPFVHVYSNSCACSIQFYGCR